MLILGIDTETTGLPPRDRRRPPEDWPHVVQISAVLLDAEKLELVEVVDLLLRLPNGMSVPPESTRVHGITDARLLLQGEHPERAIADVSRLARRADVIVGHNLGFDLRMLELTAERYGLRLSSALLPGERKTLKPRVCTMKEGTPLCRLPAKYRGLGWKYPRLAELAQHLFHETPPGLHDSLVDVLVCLRCHVQMWAGVDIFRIGGRSFKDLVGLRGLRPSPRTSPNRMYSRRRARR